MRLTRRDRWMLGVAALVTVGAVVVVGSGGLEAVPETVGQILPTSTTILETTTTATTEAPTTVPPTATTETTSTVPQTVTTSATSTTVASTTSSRVPSLLVPAGPDDSAPTTTTSAASSTTSGRSGDDGFDDGLSPGAIVALIISGLVAVAGAVGWLTWVYWRRTSPGLRTATASADGEP